MNKNQVSYLALGVLFALTGACGSPDAVPAKPVQLDAPHLGLIPAPSHSNGAVGTFRVAATTDVLFSGGEGARDVAQYFVELIKQQRPDLAFRAPREDAPASGSIAFVLAADEKGQGAEGYSLSVTPKGVTITARTPAGLFYGAVTLWQLITAERHAGPVRRYSRAAGSPTRRASRWRGLMLDSARHFQSPEYIKQFIDWMALHKLNVLHWHLVDDQAWRLEIKKYPKLTSVGAWRVPAGQAPLTDIDPATGKPRQYGGFYTQDQVRDIVAHAAKRHINVVPEIEMPGHATAAVVAYPELGVTNKPPKAVPEEWGIFPTLFNVDDSTFTFLENVLAEVIELFPSEYIHVGGDEALKDEWHASPKIQARMKELGVKDEHALQSYFIQRIGKFIDAKGRKLIGWDEILEGGLAAERHRDVVAWHRRRDRRGQGGPRHRVVAGARSVSRPLAERRRHLARPQQHAVAQGRVPVQSAARGHPARAAQTRARAAGQPLGGDSCAPRRA